MMKEYVVGWLQRARGKRENDQEDAEIEERVETNSPVGRRGPHIRKRDVMILGSL
ncbi:MAG: hypothetical protein INR71_11635 [Terriglobus roseus]|nr:hypothetical protein [Terriglobus roseus]